MPSFVARQRSRGATDHGLVELARHDGVGNGLHLTPAAWTASMKHEIKKAWGWAFCQSEVAISQGDVQAEGAAYATMGEHSGWMSSQSIKKIT